MSLKYELASEELHSVGSVDAESIAKKMRDASFTLRVDALVTVD